MSKCPTCGAITDKVSYYKELLAKASPTYDEIVALLEKFNESRGVKVGFLLDKMQALEDNDERKTSDRQRVTIFCHYSVWDAMPY